ncbi:hypothetical protein TSUD_187490 [Trifolium subterraneum]|uniref:Pectin acetylesterase n=1 Tax=Trifolium subterraneum TaxID=3900 RepID=A0A2Z6NNR6_TRISU|nr:hypothetical protein TSUD_187490 [Trifolium subterraneum]
MESSIIIQWLNTFLLFALLLLKTQGQYVPITRLESAVSKGAVCLDGSPPAYHFDEGHEEGVKNWIVHIEISTIGIESRLGTVMDHHLPVMLKKLIQGQRIFNAVMEELLAKGMDHAENVILSGCSAGGLTAILHCDGFRELLPSGTKVKCVSDAGYFVNVKDISGDYYIEDYYSQVVATHGSEKNLPQSCTSKLSPGLCFFPQYMASSIRTPLFIVNAAYDSWQIKNILAPGDADPNGQWSSCKTNLNNCSPEQLNIMQDYRTQFLEALSPISNSSSNGMFIDSCYVHCQTEPQDTWFTRDSPMVDNKTVAKAVGDWFYERDPSREIDCTYPCNPTCQNRVLDVAAYPGIH